MLNSKLIYKSWNVQDRVLWISRMYFMSKGWVNVWQISEKSSRNIWAVLLVSDCSQRSYLSWILVSKIAFVFHVGTCMVLMEEKDPSSDTNLHGFGFLSKHDMLTDIKLSISQAILFWSWWFWWNSSFIPNPFYFYHGNRFLVSLRLLSSSASIESSTKGNTL